MMAGRLLATCLKQDLTLQARGMASLAKIGNRDIVGHGFNGQLNYIDKFEHPMPAVRFKENTPDIMVLREKEKGDWKKLSIEEKKTLYRASFCQTLSEMDAPTGDWKGAIAVALMSVTLSLWMYMFYKGVVYTPLPDSFSEESQLAQLERMKVLRVNPITGITSK